MIYGTALMSECERLFEIIDTLKAEKGVIRDGVKALLLGTSALTGAALVETDEFVADAVAHVRALHPKAVSRSSCRLSRWPFGLEMPQVATSPLADLPTTAYKRTVH